MTLRRFQKTHLTQTPEMVVMMEIHPTILIMINQTMMNLEMQMTGFYKSCLILPQASAHSTNLPLGPKS